MNARPSFFDSGETRTHDVTFPSGECRLVGRLFMPQGRPKAVVVLNGATGVPARFYAAFARWLADEKAMACLTYDYRDFGASAVSRTSAAKATMTHWGVHDQNAARAYVRDLLPEVPIWVIGHSLGAMCLPFQTHLDEIERVIGVASGLVHVSDHPWPYQALARMFWYGPFPLATLALGYMPGKAMRVGEDIPRGVYWQWRRWCTRKEFYAGDFGRQMPFPDWTGLTAPMKFVAVADDDLAPPKAVWRMMQCYPEARKSQLVLRPEAFGLDTIGHINVLSDKSRAVWEDIVA